MQDFNPYKSEQQFYETVDIAIDNMDQYYMWVQDIDAEIKSPILILNDLLKSQPTSESCFAVATIMDYFLNYKESLFKSIKKEIHGYAWRIEPYMQRYNCYKYQEYREEKEALEIEMQKQEKKLDREIDKCNNYLLSNDPEYSNCF